MNPIQKFTQTLLDNNTPGDFDPIEEARDVTLIVDEQGDGTKAIEGVFLSTDLYIRLLEECEARKELADAYLSADYHRIARAVIWVENVTKENYQTQSREDFNGYDS